MLPPHRVEQLVDFARFLEAQLLNDELFQEEVAADIEADNERWDALLATEASQTMLAQLANEALSDYRAGKAKPIVFDEEGRMRPG